MAEQPIKYLHTQELLDLGLLHEINRLLLHPLGLAAQVQAVPGTDTVASLSIWDYRDDPEGIRFGDDLLSARKAERVAAMMFTRREERRKRVGFVIQPVDSQQPVLTTTYIDPAERVKG